MLQYFMHESQVSSILARNHWHIFQIAENCWLITTNDQYQSFGLYFDLEKALIFQVLQVGYALNLNQTLWRVITKNIKWLKVDLTRYIKPDFIYVA